MASYEVRYTDKYVKIKVFDWAQGTPYSSGTVNYKMTYTMGNTKFNPLYFTFFK